MFSKAKYHIIAVLVFAIVSAFYFVPQYSGKDVRQFDNIQANGTRASIEKTIEEYGEHPQWIDNMFGGMPSYTFDMDSTSKHILEPVVSILNIIQKPASTYFLLMLGFYFMALCFGMSPLVAIVGALAWGLSTYFYIIYTAGHIMKLIAMVYIAPLIGSIYLAYNKKLILGGALAGLFAALEIRSVHPQVTYYFLFVILALVVALAVKYYKEGKIRKFLIKTAILSGFAFLAVGANSVYLYYTLDYTKESTRGKPILQTEQTSGDTGLDKEYITAWSYGKAETLNLLIPNLYGGSSEGGFEDRGDVYKSLRKYGATNITQQLPAYWGPQPMTSGPVYIGAVIIFIFIMSLFLVRGALFWSMISVTILALLLAWGKNLMFFSDLFIDYFPLYSKFRTVSMILLIVEFTVPFLAMFALQKIIDNQNEIKKNIKALSYTFAILASMLLLFALFADSLFSFVSDSDLQYGLPQDVISAMQSERLTLMQKDTLRSLFFVVLTAGVMYTYIKRPQLKNIAFALLAALVLFDMVPINKRYLNNDHFVDKKQATTIPMSNADYSIIKDTTNYRVANFSVSIFNDATTSMYHRSVGGYSAVKPRRYQDLIDKYLSQQNMKIYSLLNTKYFISSEQNGAQKVTINPNAMGVAWFVDKAVWVDTPNQEIDMLDKIDLRTQAVVSKEFENEIKGKFYPKSNNDFIVQTHYQANRWIFKYNVSSDRLVAMSEMYFPNGWTAKAGEKELDLVRVNYDFFGFVLPQGEGEIVFEFNPPYFGLIDGIAIASSLILLLLIVVSGYITFSKKEKLS